MAAGDVDIIDLHGRRRGGITFEEIEGGAVAPSIEAESEFDIAAVAAVDDFLDVFGETIIYYPLGGSPREITAIVKQRDLPAGLDGMPRGKSPIFIIQVANDATKGIASYEIDDSSHDKIGLPVRLGQTAQQRPILQLLKHDYAWCSIEVR